MIKQRIIRIIKAKKGSSYVSVAVITLIISMFLSLVFFYASLMTTISRTREDTQRVLDSFCSQKAVEIYSSIKNGTKNMTSGTYTKVFMDEIIFELGLAISGNLVYNIGNRGIIYYYANPLTSNLSDDTLTLTMDYTLVIPVTFAGKKLFDLSVPLKAESAYVLKE